MTFVFVRKTYFLQNVQLKLATHLDLDIWRTMSLCGYGRGHGYMREYINAMINKQRHIKLLGSFNTAPQSTTDEE